MITWFKRQGKPAKIAIIGAVIFWALVGIGAQRNSVEKANEESRANNSQSVTSEPTAKPETKTTAPVKTTPAPPPVDPAAEAAAYRAECKNIEFRALNKNPDSYMGQKYSVQGQVIQILESGNSTDIRLNVTPAEYGDYWTDTIYITYAGKTDALDKSIINVYGTVAGKYTYESQANYNISLPLIKAEYIDIVTL